MLTRSMNRFFPLGQNFSYIDGEPKMDVSTNRSAIAQNSPIFNLRTISKIFIDGNTWVQY